MGRRGAGWRDLRPRSRLVLGSGLYLCPVREFQNRKFGVLCEPDRTAREQRLWRGERPGAGYQPIRDANAQSTVLAGFWKKTLKGADREALLDPAANARSAVRDDDQWVPQPPAAHVLEGGPNRCKSLSFRPGYRLPVARKPLILMLWPKHRCSPLHRMLTK